MNRSIKWLPWSERSFKKAQDDRRPVLLSISATWCHWCHVMDDNTFSNETVIDTINDQFIPIRIDNDKRPDINRRYNMGGWPSVAFLTPSKKVITGTTYEPPDTLLKLLNEVSDYFQQNGDTLIQDGVQIKKKESKTGDRIPANVVDVFIEQAKNDFDKTHGGFGFSPKFPFIDALGLLLEVGYKKKEDELTNIVVTTLKKMASGDIFDKISGGFFRYATKKDWSIPHYEKMLEDNSKLLSLFIKTYQIKEEPLLLTTAIHIFDYLNSVLRGDKGFFGSQDADEKFYISDASSRAEMEAPRIDKTVFMDWNALAISSFLLFSAVAKSKEASALALETLDNISNAAFSNKFGFMHYIDKAEPSITGLLEDNALMIEAHIDAYEETGNEDYIESASSIASLMIENLWDKESMIFIDNTENDIEAGSKVLPSIVDNSISALALIRLGRLLEDDELISYALSALEYFQEDYGDYGLIAASYGISVNSLQKQPIDISFVGDIYEIGALLKEIRLKYLPGLIIRRGRLAEERIGSEESGVYICVNKKCFPPAKTIDQLLKTLDEVKTQ